MDGIITANSSLLRGADSDSDSDTCRRQTADRAAVEQRSENSSLPRRLLNSQSHALCFVATHTHPHVIDVTQTE